MRWTGSCFATGGMISLILGIAHLRCIHQSIYDILTESEVDAFCATVCVCVFVFALLVCVCLHSGHSLLSFVFISATRSPLCVSKPEFRLRFDPFLVWQGPAAHSAGSSLMCDALHMHICCIWIDKKTTFYHNTLKRQDEKAQIQNRANTNFVTPAEG